MTSHLAHFIVQGIEHAGLVELNGPKTELQIYSAAFLRLDDEEMKELRGISKDGVCITAIDSVGADMAGTATYYGKTRHFMSVAPHVVVMGPRHLEAKRDDIASISFSFSQANELFYDLGTFGRIKRTHGPSFGQLRDILRYVRRAPKNRRRGGHLDLYFQWHRGPIVEIRCSLGTITAGNFTTSKSPSPAGLDVRNRVRVTCRFTAPVNLDTALGAIYQTTPFFELVTQSRQNIEDIRVSHKDAVQEAALEVYVRHNEHTAVEDLQPTDVLVSGGLHSEEFGSAFSKWIDTNSDRRAARQRFMQGFRHGHSCEIDRLIGAANAFDLLPLSDFGKAVGLPAEVEALLSSLESQVKVAAKGSELVSQHKERLLNTLSMVRGLNLRNKVLQRYATLPKAMTARLPAMEEIIAHSIRARNYFVHGSTTKFSVEATYDLYPFFTDTLEFIFATTELLACGWNSERWVKEGFTRSRLKRYMQNYELHKQRVDAALDVDSS